MAINLNVGGPPAPIETPLLGDQGLLNTQWVMFFKALELVATTFATVCDTGLPLTDTYQDVPDCETTLTLPGVWLVLGVFDFTNIGAAENGALGQLLVDDVPQVGWAQQGINGASGDLMDGTRMMFWVVENVSISVTSPTVAKLQAKTNVAGSGHLNPDSTKMLCMFLRPSRTPGQTL